MEDIENAVVAYNPRSRAPILVRQLATVSVGPEMRRGITDFNGEQLNALAEYLQGLK